jgi:hypothetical protein
MWTTGTTMEISMELHKKAKNTPTYDPAIPLLGMHLKEC